MNHACHLFQLLDGVLKLLVEYPSIGHNNNRVKDPIRISLRRIQMGQQMGEPCDRVRLATAGGVLDQVVVSNAFSNDRSPELTNHVELVVSWEDKYSKATGLCLEAL